MEEVGEAAAAAEKGRQGNGLLTVAVAVAVAVTVDSYALSLYGVVVCIFFPWLSLPSLLTYL